MTYSVIVYSLLATTARLSDDSIDGVPFAIGVITCFRQFHPSLYQTYLDYLGQHVRGQLHASATAEVGVIFHFAEILVHYSGVEVEWLDELRVGS